MAERRAVTALGDLHFLKLFMMRKTKAISSSVSITPAKKAKTKCSLLLWWRKGADDPWDFLKALRQEGDPFHLWVNPEIAFTLVSQLAISPPSFQLLAFSGSGSTWGVSKGAGSVPLKNVHRTAHCKFYKFRGFMSLSRHGGPQIRKPHSEGKILIYYYCCFWSLLSPNLPPQVLKAKWSTQNQMPWYEMKWEAYLGWPEGQGAEVTAEAVVGWVPGPLCERIQRGLVHRQHLLQPKGPVCSPYPSNQWSLTMGATAL